MIGSNTMWHRSGLLRLWFLALSCLAAACSERPSPPASAESAPAQQQQRAPAAVSPATPDDPDAAPARPRIVAYGDSLTAGLGLLEQEAYPARLQAKIDELGYKFEVVNAGLSGDTSAGGVRRLDWALEGDVRVLIVAFGGNDGLRGLPVAQMKENLATIIDKARARNAVVILAGMEAPPNFGQEYATAFRQAFKEVALAKRALFMPFLLKDVAGNSELNQSDGIHPNQQGAQIIADNLWVVLEPLLDQMSGTS
jgi:acyl-CoA thioesterase I